MNQQIIIEVWGDLACFTRPEAKVERLSYPIPTPSSMRGVLNAIYSKPPLFYWQINRIEILNPIKFINCKRNEVKVKTDGKRTIVVDDMENVRTQRQSVILQDVRYRVYASIIRHSDCIHTIDQLYQQANRRIENGKCFYQPSLGCREFVAYFEKSDLMRLPIDHTQDIGLMLYDVFDLNKTEPLVKGKPYVSLFHAKIEKGIIEIPDFNDISVLKPGGCYA